MKAVPDQIARFLGHRNFVPLGTDGFGRSDTRDNLRRYFEVDTAHLVVATLSALAASKDIGADTVSEAIGFFGLDPETPDPAHII